MCVCSAVLVTPEPPVSCRWQTLIETIVDVKTTDGYVLRVFTVAFTKKTKFQTKKSAYAQSAQVRAIRKKMVDIITSTVQKCDLREFVAKHLYVQLGGVHMRMRRAWGERRDGCLMDNRLVITPSAACVSCQAAGDVQDRH